ncbi:MAG: outer membrane lipoprotein LolB [Betaproteobacteria bacterium HGW-Betaproteobacteria-2]|nr:MAG: outer membrane lipoprotein LolB [Betaproteobacteria bacterium HGW-Betaproteobacteria-2]
MRILYSSWLGIFSLLLLSGCAALKPVPESQLPTPVGSPAELNRAHLEQLASINQFHLQARIGIQANGKGSSGSTRWRHNVEGNDISMLSPVGGTVAKIITNTEGVTLTTNDGKVLQAKDAEALTEEHLGWRLPLQGLPDWALGRPTKRIFEEMHWDNIGRITRLKQDGWDIEYPEYMEAGGYRLPKRINLRSRNLTLKLIIERWDDLGAATTLSATTPIQK